MSTDARSPVLRFRAAIVQRLGLWFDDARLEFLDQVLANAVARADDRDAYLDRLEAGTSARAEIRALAGALTVGETYFFRNIEQFDALRGVALPQIADARASRRRVRVLSAGCASGEEPYSLAIALREFFAAEDPAWSIDVRGVDINPAALARAREGRYSRWSLREMGDTQATRWLRPSGSAFVLDPEIRGMVELVERNLLDADPVLWQAESYDVVFCRNVLMYFAPEQARTIVARIVAALAPGGWLFLGHAESLRGLGSALELCHTHGTFYYRRSSAAAAEPSTPASTGWFDEIDGATSRVRSLLERDDSATDTNAPTLAHPDVEPAARRDAALLRAAELLERERYAEAIATLDALPLATADDAEARLLRAVLLTHGGRLDDAELTCRGLLEAGDNAAEAHFLLALCADRRGDATTAADHDRIAIHVDAGFAMPRLHLGLMARRRGDFDAARRELGQASALLHAEPSARLLLFGGGFGRDALLAIARAELVACGGRT